MNRTFSTLSQDYGNKSVLLLGLGISGRATANVLLEAGAIVCAVDQNWQQLANEAEVIALCHKGMILCPADNYTDMTNFDAVIVSPGISSKNPLFQKALSSKAELIGEIELAFRYIKNPCVGVTGTNGKTTVTSLITHVLNDNRIEARAVGNIGVPLTGILHQSEKTLLVVELSSYQLETLNSRSLDAAILLNVTPDHLERHETMEEYSRVKEHIFNCVKPDGHCYSYNRNNGFESEISHLLPKSYVGHDRSNALAAYVICRHWGITEQQFLKALETFRKPPHRLELIATIKEIDYVDDSKATNIDAVIRAVEWSQKPVLLIAGGVDKGSSYQPWLKVFDGKVRKIYVIGKAALKIIGELSHMIPIELCSSLDEAVHGAANSAVPGDMVLLSPGCSSYDMFSDYAHRGREFQRIVGELNI